MELKTYANVFLDAVLSLIVIVVRNEISETSSNPGRDG